MEAFSVVYATRAGGLVCGPMAMQLTAGGVGLCPKMLPRIRSVNTLGTSTLCPQRYLLSIQFSVLDVSLEKLWRYQSQAIACKIRGGD